MDYTTTALLSSIKNRVFIPTSQLTLQDTDLLSLAGEELRLGVVPLMLKMRSNYFATHLDTLLTSNNDTYSIPYRAVGGKLQGLNLVDAQGNVFDFPEIDKSERPFYNGSATNSGFVHYFEGNNVIVVPSPSASTIAYIRFNYYFRTGDLVATSAAAQITAIAGNVVTVSAAPSAFTTALQYDVINGSPGFEPRGYDLAVTTIAGANITFTALPAKAAIGDWIAQAGQSPIAQIPYELHPLLAQRTGIRVLAALGDAQSLQMEQAKLKEMEEAATHILAPRSEMNPKKLNNRFSTLRTSSSSKF